MSSQIANCTEKSAAPAGRSTAAPRVLASILNFNYFSKCCVTVRDMLAQDYPNFHLQVLDSASTDGSFEKLLSTFPEVDIRSTGENLGYARGNNVALRQGLEQGYDYVLALNGDLLIPPHCLTRMVATAQRQPDAGLIGCMVKHHASGAWQSCGGRFSWLRGMDIRSTRAPASNLDEVSVMTVHGCAVMFSRKAIEAGLFMDESMYLYVDELDLGLRAKALGLTAHVCTGAVIRHDNYFAPGRSAKPGRAYYVTRNRVYLTLKYAKWWQKPLFLGQLALEAAYKNVVYRCRGGRASADAYNRGLVDGMKGKLGPRDGLVL